MLRVDGWGYEQEVVQLWVGDLSVVFRQVAKGLWAVIECLTETGNAEEAEEKTEVCVRE